MEWFEVEQNRSHTCEFPERSLPGYEQMMAKPLNDRCISSEYIGGIVNHGKWGWLTRQHDEEATLLICDLNNGYRVANYTFWRAGDKKVTDSQRCFIRFVEEIFPSKPVERVLLAICIQIGLTKSKIAIYTPSSSQVLRYIPLCSGILVTSMAFLDQCLRDRTAMLEFDGCLAVGTELGTVLMIDMHATNVVNTRSTNLCLPDAHVQRAEILLLPFISLTTAHHVHPHLQRARDQNMHLALELDLFGQSKVYSSIRSLLPMNIISGIAAGMEDGRIFIYDLNVCKLLKMWSPSDIEPGPVIRMCTIVPPDDPMPCFYLCAIHQKGVGLMATLYSINYRNSVVRPENEQIQFLNFQSVSIRMCLILDNSQCSLMGCNTASTFPFAGDNGTLLTAISWYSHTDEKNKLILFDINQWYKDEMPSHPRPNEKPNYLCGYVLNGRHTGLNLRLNVHSISPFLTLHRCDEHFYPNSLSFDCSLLTITGFRQYKHVGIQSRFIYTIYTQMADLFLNPQPYLHEMMRIRLMPQFFDYNEHNVLSQREVYEVIFSMVLEQNCVGLLYNCAKYCFDGSFLCNMLNHTRLTLSMLTNWIVTRAGQIKSRCSELCQGIFDFGGYSLDEREREEYKELNRQLLALQQLQARIVCLGKKSLAPEQIEDLERTDKTLTTLYEFQCLLYWLIEQGLLPEGHEAVTRDQQPLQLLRREYVERRAKLSQTNLKLYIDELLLQSSLKLALQYRCLEDGNYPPHSLQAYMHLMLLSDAKLLHKQELLLYMLFDMDHMSSENSRQLSQDFIRSFGLADSLVCGIKCFWFMDRGDFEQAIKTLYSSLDEFVNLTDWQTKMLVEVLLANGANKEALQLVYRPRGRITFELHLKVLLANDNIPEAFNFARLYYDESGKSLLEFFFEHIIRTGKYSVLASLYLREHEEQLVYRLLRQCKTRQTDTVQLILLLKRSKYIEAVSFMDEVAAEQRRGPNAESLSKETNSILSAYRTTMAPVSQSIAGTYFRIRNNLSGDQLRNDSPEPFSCQLAKQNASGKLSNIFQSSALSVHWATRYRNEQQSRSLNSRNMPFLRNAAQATNHMPQRPRLVRPTPYQFVEKRSLHYSQRDGANEQACKRRRLLSDHFEEDVDAFIPTRVEYQPLEQAEVEVLQEQQLVTALLEAPIYLQFQTVQAQPISDIERRRIPPAILKRHASLRIAEQPATVAAAAAATTSSAAAVGAAATTSPAHAHETFRLLSSLSEREDHGNAMDTGSDSEEQQEEEETDEIIVEIEQQSASPNPHLNTEQSSESVSDSEYLSPLPTTSLSFGASQKVSNSFAPPSGPQPRSSLFLGRSEQSSSGFGSFATVRMENTHSLQLNEFLPPVCSSKMFDVAATAGQHKSTTTTVSNSMAMHVKISERSTICVDADEPSAVTSGMGLWNMPTGLTSAAQPTQLRQSLRMLDTTLSMSSYDMTSLEAPQEPELNLKPDSEEKPETEIETPAKPVQQSEPAAPTELQSQFEPLIVEQAGSMIPLDYIELDDDEDDEQQMPGADQDQQLDVERNSESSSEEEASAMDYNQVSPSYSVSSELSELSEVASLLPSRQDAPVFSIVVESTNSITTSRSPPSHTPTSFLPSDTNVSQNSSPRAAHGADGSNRSLYRANSLETVDDLDTTKGSLEEEEDNDEEDDCVIALDGTEVRGYVARPEPVAACSSAELFAFKQQHDAVDEPTQLLSAAASLGATANSDSVQAYTINLDSVDSSGEHDGAAQLLQSTVTQHAVGASDPGTSNDSVATVAFSEHKQQLHEAEPELRQEYIQTTEEQQVEATKITEHAEPSQIVNLDSCQDVEIIETETQATPAEFQMNLKLAIEGDAIVMEDMYDRLAECEQQTADIDYVMEHNHSLKSSISDDEKAADQSRKFTSPTVVRIKRLRMDTLRTRMRLRSDDLAQSEDLNTRDTPSPVSSLRRTARRRSGSQSSHTSEDLPPAETERVEKSNRRPRRNTISTNPNTGTEGTSPEIAASVEARPVTRGRRQLRSSVSEESTVTTRSVARAGSLPPTTSVPKGRKRLIQQLDVIEEVAENSPQPRTPLRSAKQSQLSSRLVGGDKESSASPALRRSRCRSEPPVATKPAPRPRRQTKPNDEQEPSTSTGRARRRTVEQISSPMPDVIKVSEANVPLKKRGRK